MRLQLHNLPASQGARKRRKIVGRGPGSGHGKTSTRGFNGQKARSGRGIMRGSEGGQMALIRRLPKVGFRTKNPTLYQVVSLASLNHFKEGTVVNPLILKSQGIIKRLTKPYKILADGEIKKALTIQAYSFSKSAEEKILKAGGKIEKIGLIDVTRLQEAEQANKK